MRFSVAILGAAGCLSIGAAQAADLASRKELPLAPPPPPAFSWTGIRLGVNGGWAGGTANPTATMTVPSVGGLPAFGTVTSGSANLSGGIVGGQSSALWQLSNNIVIGYESDFQWSGSRSQTNNLATVAGAGIDWFGTERGRIGYAFGRFLPYVTGGLAYGKLTGNVSQVVGNAAFAAAGSSTQAGWTVGGGLEYAFTDSISVKVEYLYAQFQGMQRTTVGIAYGPNGATALAPVQFNTGTINMNIARVGVNYKFDVFGTILAATGLTGL
jgi:outer membrane immunogenic protein